MRSLLSFLCLRASVVLVLAAGCFLVPSLGRAEEKHTLGYTEHSTALTGQSGLVRVLSAWKVPRGTLVNKLSGAFFTHEPFMLGTQSHTRIGGYMAFTLSPAIVDEKSGAGQFRPPEWETFELAFSYSANSHVNEDVQSGSKLTTDATGDVDVGLKYALPWVLAAETIHFGASASMHMLSRLTDLGPDPTTISPSFRLLQSLDLTRYFPFQFHANVGYLVDRSIKIFDEDQPLPPRWRRFSQGVFQEDSYLLGVGMDFPLFRFIPFVEVMAWVDTDGKVLNDAGQKISLQSFRQNPILATVGLRSFVTKRIAVDVGVDLGYLSGDFPDATDEGQRRIVPPWQMLASISYSVTPQFKELIRRRPEGRLYGRVVDEETGAPLERVVLTLTGPQKILPQMASEEGTGKFRLDRVTPGEYKVVAFMEGYARVEQPFEINVRKITRVDLAMRREIHTGGLAGSLQSGDGKLLAGLVFIQKAGEKRVRTVSTDPATGEYRTSLGPGSYTLHAEASGFRKSAPQSVGVEVGRETAVSFRLEPAEGPKLIRITQEKIEILQKIHFRSGRATIIPISFPVLDEIAQVLRDNPEVRVRVEGHTDNQGGLNYNMKLSQQRAEAIVAYLGAKGARRDRLTPVGFGPQSPIASNATDRGRAENRRVEFMVVGGQFRELVSEQKVATAPEAARFAVVAREPAAAIYRQPEGRPFAKASKGRKFPIMENRGEWISVRLGDGREVWLKKSDVVLVGE